MNYLFGPDCSCHGGRLVNAIYARVLLSQRSNQLGRHIVSCDPAKQITITKKQRAEFRLANMDCISEHCLENGFELGGRTADDLQHLGCRALLLPRLGELTGARLKLLLELACVRLELLFRCRLRFLGPAEMTHAGRPKLRIRLSRKHSTPGRPLCEPVHAAGPNDGANFQVKITSLPNGLIGGTSSRSHQTLTRHRGDPEHKRSFGSIDLPSSLVTDLAMEAWYHA